MWAVLLGMLCASQYVSDGEEKHKTRFVQCSGKSVLSLAWSIFRTALGIADNFEFGFGNVDATLN